MRATALPFLLLMGLPLLAGCLSDDADLGEAMAPYAVPATGLESGAAYAFDHVGGSLSIGLDGDGSAVAALYDPQDIRLGVLELGADAFRRDVHLDELDPGSYVVKINQLNGTLDVRSGGTSVAAFQELGTHFERIALVDRPIETDATLGLLPAAGVQAGGEAVDLDTNITLQRTPTLMRLYAAGSGSDVHVQVRGGAGTVLAYDGDYGNAGSTSEPQLVPLGADFFSFNVRDATLDVVVEAQAMDGALILEAWSYSRLVPSPAVPASRVAMDDMPFTYGSVPSRPVLFQVHDRASALYVWSSLEDPRFADGWGGSEDGGDGGSGSNNTGGSNATGSPQGSQGSQETRPEGPVPWILLFGPDDRRLGAYPVPAGVILRIPIDGGGDHVAVAKSGDVYLGADRAPINFQLSVLDVQETVLPSDPAGSTDRYGQRNGSADVAGVPYSVRPTMAEPEGSSMPPGPDDIAFTGCSDEGTVRVVQDGETLGFVRPGSGSEVDRLDLHVVPGMTFIQDGLGGSCGHQALAVQGYLR